MAADGVALKGVETVRQRERTVALRLARATLERLAVGLSAHLGAEVRHAHGSGLFLEGHAVDARASDRTSQGATSASELIELVLLRTHHPAHQFTAVRRYLSK